jgi:hypothetical protein
VTVGDSDVSGFAVENREAPVSSPTAEVSVEMAVAAPTPSLAGSLEASLDRLEERLRLATLADESFAMDQSSELGDPLTASLGDSNSWMPSTDVLIERLHAESDRLRGLAEAGIGDLTPSTEGGFDELDDGDVESGLTSATTDAVLRELIGTESLGDQLDEAGVAEEVASLLSLARSLIGDTGANVQ